VLSAEKTYPDGTHALQPVDLRIEEGEFVTLLGPSGCGKSTLLKMIAGLLEPSDGRLLLWRRPVPELHSCPNKLAFVFQSPTLMPWASVQGNVRLPLDLADVPHAQAQERVDDALALVGLSGFAQALPRTLSGGMQMRVSIARGLATQPDLLLMDEPFGALDAMTREKMNLELQRIWSAAKKTVLLITHSIPESIFLSDRVLVMSERPGSIAAIYDVPLPRPRTLAMMGGPEFGALAQKIRAHFYAQGSLDA
jgi:NitT/TauT family transport system ATP-binding protein